VRVANVEVIGGNENVFSVANGCRGTVKMEEDCRIDVKFEPTSAGGKELKVTITNSGPIDLPVTATSLSGQNEQQFEQSNDCPTELAPGKSCASTVVVRPTYQGHHEAVLTVWAKGGAPETEVSLSGTGS